MKSAVRIYQPLDTWHHWFAWYPVRLVSGSMARWVWLETIQRKITFAYYDFRAEYRLLK